jgi:hypothetical protein
MLFEFSGRKILFEVLATASQVSRDLRILDKTKADVKIAVIIDPEIDSSVIERFLKENPEDNYPYIFIGELFEQSLMHQVVWKMLEITTGNEEAKFKRMLNQKISTNFLEMCKKEGLQILSSEDLESKNITFQKLFLTVITKRLMDLGANREQLRDLLRWMSDEEMLKFILMKINFGFNMFLYTDLNETKAIYSDNELMDWIRASYILPEARILLSLNCVVSYVIDNFYKDADNFTFNRQIIFTIGNSEMINEPDGKIITLSIPRNTKQIHVYRPMKPHSDKSNELTPEDYIKMMEFLY